MHAVRCMCFTVTVGENLVAQIVQNISQVGLFDEVFDFGVWLQKYIWNIIALNI